MTAIICTADGNSSGTGAGIVLSDIRDKVSWLSMQFEYDFLWVTIYKCVQV